MDHGIMGDNRPGIMNQNTPETATTFSAQMREFLHRNMNWFLAGGLALLLLQDIFGTHGLIAMRRSQKEAAQAQQQIDQINKENRELLERVKELKTDPAAIEQIAREEMGLARPGEYIFRLPDKPGDPSTLAAPPAAAQPKP
jgi:cell division protein FtsB